MLFKSSLIQHDILDTVWALCEICILYTENEAFWYCLQIGGDEISCHKPQKWEVATFVHQFTIIIKI